jgi:hypothetical protein
MSMGSSGSNSATTTSQMPSWAQGAGQSLLSAMQGLVFGGPGGSPTSMPSGLNQSVAPLTGAQQGGLGALNKAASGPVQGLSNSANSAATNQLNGSMLNASSNPYLQSYSNAAAQSMIGQYQTATAPGNMASAQQAGMFNSNAAADQSLMSQYSLGNNLQSLNANIYEPAYQQGIQNQLQTMSMVPSLQQASLLPGQTQFGTGSVQQAQNQAGLNTNFQNALSSFQFPYQELSQLGGSIGQATGGASTVTSTGPGPSGK